MSGDFEKLGKAIEAYNFDCKVYGDDALRRLAQATDIILGPQASNPAIDQEIFGQN